mmetsp:Transcript_114315/g.301863  ORF Transcript_114315/g.301863 Transcript_114315/m.301863 type:complete len:248 (-) Transcript_114315:35-778(-)
MHVLHGCVPQAAASDMLPASHSLPPCRGSEATPRFLSMRPPPQVVVQVPHCSQSPSLQSTTVQFDSEQAFTSFSETAQEGPWRVTLRERSAMPSPHMREQGDQSAQSDSSHFSAPPRHECSPHGSTSSVAWSDGSSHTRPSLRLPSIPRLLERWPLQLPLHAPHSLHRLNSHLLLATLSLGVQGLISCSGALALPGSRHSETPPASGGSTARTRAVCVARPSHAFHSPQSLSSHSGAELEQGTSLHI